MLLIRPVTMDDLDGLMALATLASFGLTTLPKDCELLGRRVRASLRGFEKADDEPPGGEAYLFVMEDTATGRIVGTSGLIAKVGGFEPFYAYRIETTVHESKMLAVRKEVQALHLVADHAGPSEIGSLLLHPEYRGGGNGRALSLGRFLFLAEHPRLFDNRVIAEMRGVIDDRGHSPFWDAIGRHFFDIELAKADALSIVNKQFIGDLMPAHPIYIPLLPDAAQRVIGEVHDETRPALRLLESEGFDFTGMVDIFEAGPILGCQRDRIRTVRQSRRAVLADTTEERIESPAYLVSNTQRDFRFCQAHLRIEGEGEAVVLHHEVAEALRMTPGEPVRYAPLRG